MSARWAERTPRSYSRHQSSISINPDYVENARSILHTVITGIPAALHSAIRIGGVYRVLQVQNSNPEVRRIEGFGSASSPRIMSHCSDPCRNREVRSSSIILYQCRAITCLRYEYGRRGKRGGAKESPEITDNRIMDGTAGRLNQHNTKKAQIFDVKPVTQSSDLIEHVRSCPRKSLQAGIGASLGWRKTQA